MQNNAIILFTVIPLVAGLLSVPLAGRVAAQRALGVTSLLATLILAITLLIDIRDGPDGLSHAILEELEGTGTAVFASAPLYGANSFQHAPTPKE